MEILELLGLIILGNKCSSKKCEKEWEQLYSTRVQ